MLGDLLDRFEPPYHDERDEDEARRLWMTYATREEWEAYERAMFEAACEDKAEFTVRCFTPEERVAYNSGLSKLFRKTGRKL